MGASGMLRGAVAATVVIGLVAAAGGAAAQSDTRQHVTFAFDERAPGAATGVRLDIDYV